MFYYGMKYRPFGIGCQPKGFIEVMDVESDKPFYNILAYDRELTATEVLGYELSQITFEETV